MIGLVTKHYMRVLGELPLRNIAPKPKTNSNPNPNPNTNREAIFLGAIVRVPTWA